MPVTAPILTVAAERFAVDPRQVAPRDRSGSPFYTCLKGSQACTLRVMSMPEEQLPRYVAKVRFACWLAQEGLPLTLPMPSIDGEPFAILRAEDAVFVAVLAPTAFGHQATARNPYLWNAGLFSAWGALIGRLHALAPCCPQPISAALPDWQDEMDTFEELAAGEPKVLARWQALRAPLAALPTAAGYGPILNDLHQYNFRYHPDLPGAQPITIAEFDAAVSSWFLSDIAVAVYHATTDAARGPLAERQAFARLFLSHFLDGYARENHFNPAWMQHLPLFLAYREILVYLALSKEWPMTHRSQWQSNFLAGKRARILRNEPLIGHIAL